MATRTKKLDPQTFAISKRSYILSYKNSNAVFPLHTEEVERLLADRSTVKIVTSRRVTIKADPRHGSGEAYVTPGSLGGPAFVAP